ncbi:MAG: hypothetical protein B7X34_01610, partial [Acidobacteriia bacterium 12-62-4]
MRILLGFAVATLAFAQDYKTWSDYGGGPDSSQYSSLRQITKENVAQLKVAWSYRIGENKKYNFNPVIVDDLMYVMGAGNTIVALQAASGKPIWTW